MHARNDEPLVHAAPEANPLAGIVAALKRGDGPEAVRQLQRAIDTHAVSCHDVVEAFSTWGVQEMLPPLVAALASTPCPHCWGGFDSCPSCNASGHGEEHNRVCAACGGMGITTCDFCGGSGLMTYDEVPEQLRAAIALRRAQSAGGRIAEQANQPLPHAVSRDQISSLRKSIMKRAIGVRRDLAILANAAQLARSMRRANSDRHAMAGQLFQRASRSAKIGQHLASRLFAILGRLSRARATHAGEAASTGFEAQRAETFESQSRQMARALRHRASLFPGH
jgi:hypothetical protein